MKWLVDYKPEFRRDICVNIKASFLFNEKGAEK
jgi:hypothetical protein